MPKEQNLQVWSALAFEDLLRQASALLRRLDKLGFRVNPSSRFHKYRNAIKDLRSAARNEIIRTNPVDLELVHQATYEVQQMTYILEELTSPPFSPGWQKKVQMAVSGTALPQDKRTYTPARNAQFELLVATLCKQAGYSIALDEPDVLVDASGLTFGIAAKRIRSVRQLGKRIRGARDQIRQSSRDGIICLDLTGIHNPTNACLITEDPRAAANTAQVTADRYARGIQKNPQGLLDEELVFGLMIHVSCLFFLSRTFQFGNAVRWSATNLCKLSDPRCAVLKELVGTIGRGIASSI